MWGMFPCATEKFLDRARADDFDAVEMIIYRLPEPPEKIAEMCAQRGLAVVSQVLTEGDSPTGHLHFMEQKICEGAAAKPALINIHTGKDHFAAADNFRLFRRALDLAGELNVKIVHETHRGRALYSALVTEHFLRELPDLRLCADFSHWMCVHESDLADQPERVELAAARASYIHARVGFAEGPQVPHPLAPEYTAERDRHLALWQRILALRRAEGCERFIVTPEFGPAPYMPRLPFTGHSVADEWRVNVEFRDWLKTRLA